MRIKKVAFWDNLREWRFEPIYFSNLALLVGVSGVGKTQILKAILNLQKIANGASLNGLAWDVTFSTINNVEYRWQGEFETKKNLPIIVNKEHETNEFRILREDLTREGSVIIERTPNEIIFKGKTTPKLSPFQSVIEILDQEEDLSPVQQTFNKIISNNFISFDHLYDRNYIRSSTISRNVLLKNIKESDMAIQISNWLLFITIIQIFSRILDAYLYKYFLKLKISK